MGCVCVSRPFARPKDLLGWRVVAGPIIIIRRTSSICLEGLQYHPNGQYINQQIYFLLIPRSGEMIHKLPVLQDLNSLNYEREGR